MSVHINSVNKKIVIFMLFISTQGYSQTEKTLWDMAFDDFLLNNGNQAVIYTTINYISTETNELIKALFIYKLSDSSGIMLYTNGETITNFFTIIYSDEYNTLICYDVSGGLFSRKMAGDILDIALKSTLQVGICKDLKELVLPSDGLLKF
jgi:hypothetical protein